MERTKIRVMGRAIRGVRDGEVTAVSRRDARLLVQLGRAEFVDADAPEPKASKRSTPVKAAKKGGAKKSALKATKATKGAKKAAKKYARRDMRAD